MKSDTRTRMVTGAVEMLARRGLAATSVREVVRQTGSPRGSIAHHFPQGKQQLVEEALHFADKAMSEVLSGLCDRHGVRSGLRQFIDGWCKHLRKNDFALGCPVLAVCVESGGDDARGDAAKQALLALSAEVLAHWREVFSIALSNEGVQHVDAQRLATVVLAAFEGAIVLCRAERSLEPLKDVGYVLDELIVRTIQAHRAPQIDSD